MENNIIKNKIEYMEKLSLLKFKILQKNRSEEALIKIYGFTKQEAEELDNKLLEEILPDLFEGLKSEKYNYEWTMRDLTFNEEVLFLEPRYKMIYRRLLELMKLEYKYDRLYYFTKELNANSPIYFDILYLANRDKKYIPFLQELIKHQFYNPNQFSSFDSSRIFYGQILDIFPSLASLVLLDKRTNFNLYHHGDMVISNIIYQTKTEYAKNASLSSNFDILTQIFKENNVSIIDTLRFSSINGSANDGNAYITDLIWNLERCPVKKVQNLFSYFISDKGIEKQLKISQYPSLGRDSAIDDYCQLIFNRRGETKGIARLKNLKLYED